jgi:hypothetical protein
MQSDLPVALNHRGVFKHRHHTQHRGSVLLTSITKKVSPLSTPLISAIAGSLFGLLHVALPIGRTRNEQALQQEED